MTGWGPEEYRRLRRAKMDKVAIVTGASGGIGCAAAEELGRQGYRLALLDLDVAANESERVLVQSCDVRSPREAERATTSTLERFGRIDVLFNSAGVSHLGTVDERELEDLERVYDVNVKGAFNMTKGVWTCMKRQKSGYIINRGSLRGIQCEPGKAAYSIGKFAVRAFARTLAVEVKDCGIRVTVINPGFVQTDLIRHRIAEEQLSPRELTQPADIARTITYLLSLSPGACVEELCLGRIW